MRRRTSDFTRYLSAGGKARTMAILHCSADSRCPANATCITAGEAVVRIDVWTDGHSSTHELRTGNMQPAKPADLTIELVEVAPYPFSSTAIDPAAYRVTLHVSR